MVAEAAAPVTDAEDSTGSSTGSSTSWAAGLSCAETAGLLGPRGSPRGGTWSTPPTRAWRTGRRATAAPGARVPVALSRPRPRTCRRRVRPPAPRRGSGRFGHAPRVAPGIVRCRFDRCRGKRLRCVGKQLGRIVRHRLVRIDRAIRLRHWFHHEKSQPVRRTGRRALRGPGGRGSRSVQDGRPANGRTRPPLRRLRPARRVAHGPARSRGSHGSSAGGPPPADLTRAPGGPTDARGRSSSRLCHRP